LAEFDKKYQIPPIKIFQNSSTLSLLQLINSDKTIPKLDKGAYAG
jgi:hypothetical protein